MQKSNLREVKQNLLPKKGRWNDLLLMNNHIVNQIVVVDLNSKMCSSSLISVCITNSLKKQGLR